MTRVTSGCSSCPLRCSLDEQRLLSLYQVSNVGPINFIITRSHLTPNVPSYNILSLSVSDLWASHATGVQLWLPPPGLCGGNHKGGTNSEIPCEWPSLFNNRLFNITSQSLNLTQICFGFLSSVWSLVLSGWFQFQNNVILTRVLSFVSFLGPVSRL